MSKMFMPIKFNTTVILTPKEFNKNFDNVIITKLKDNLENICSKHGYIKKDSIKIIKRSMGYFKEAHLNGNIAYDLSCIAEICNPTQDSIIKCVIKAKNNLGLRGIGTYDDMSILEVIIPRITSGIQSEVNIDTINVGDIVNVKVCGKKFTLYDKMISIIGKIIKDKDNIIQVEEKIEDDNSDIDDNEDELLDEGIDIIDEEDEIINEDEEDEEDDDYKRKITIINDDDNEVDVEDEEDDEEDDDEEEDEEDDDIEDEDIDELEYDEEELFNEEF